MKEALRSPVLWLAFVAVGLATGFQVAVAYDDKFPRVWSFGSIVLAGAALSMVSQAFNRDKLLERMEGVIEEIRARHEDEHGRIRDEIVGVTCELGRLRTYLAAPAIDGRFTALHGRIDNLAARVNTLAYEVQALPAVVTTRIDAERTAVALSAAGERAQQVANDATGVIVRPVEWRQRRPGA